MQIAGLSFGKLRVIERIGSNSNGQSKWRCECECGKEAVRLGGDLKSGRTSSCGCAWRTTFATTRVCPCCKIEKPHEAYGVGNSSHGMTAYCRECLAKKHRARYRANPEAYKKRLRETRAALREEVLQVYGTKCACCGEAEKMFLAIDHINNNGAAHRREIGGKGGDNFYKWLKKNDFPRGYQTLCQNCNWGKHVNGGACPHQRGHG